MARARLRVASLLTAMAAAAAAAALPAAAAGPQAGVVLAAGARSGGGFEADTAAGESLQLRRGAVAALGVEWPYDANRLLQLWFAQQRTRLRLGAAAAPGTPGEMPLTVSSVHLGGVNYFEGLQGGAGHGPYVAGGLGVTHLAPNLPGTSSRTRASMSLALGHEWALGAAAPGATASAGALSWRLELRAHLTLLNSSGGFFCSGGCTVFIRGDTLTQLEALAALRLAF